MNQPKANNHRLTNRLGIASFCAFLAILLAVIYKSPITLCDLKISNYLAQVRTPFLTEFFHYVSWLSDWPAVLAAVVVTAIVLIKRKQSLAAGLLTGVFILEEIITADIKRLVGRGRIEPALSLVKETSFSFPSGHVLRAMVVFGFLAYLAAKSDKPAWLKNTLVASCLSIVLLVSLSRLYLGAHYPSDVLASLFLGGSLLALTILINKRYN